jgi:hypothetical protein
MYFEDEATKKLYKHRRSIYCVECDSKASSPLIYFNSMKSLEKHLLSQHNKYFCQACLESREIFPCEQERFSKAELTKHFKLGSPAANEFGPIAPHEYCDFCNKPYFTADELYVHLTTQHAYCRFCDKKYLRDAAQLRKHFEKYHFLCLHNDCSSKAVEYIAFPSEIALKSHCIAVHLDKSGISKAEIKKFSTIDIGLFNYRSNNSSNRENNNRDNNNPIDSRSHSEEEDFPLLSAAAPAASSAAVSSVQNHSHAGYNRVATNGLNFLSNDSEQFPHLPAKANNASRTTRPTALPSHHNATTRLFSHIPLPLPDYCSGKNNSFIAQVKAALGDDQEKFERFKKNSAQYRNNQVNDEQYLQCLYQLFGGESASEAIVLELLAVMPDEEKRKCLHSQYAKQKILHHKAQINHKKKPQLIATDSKTFQTLQLAQKLSNNSNGEEAEKKKKEEPINTVAASVDLVDLVSNSGVAVELPSPDAIELYQTRLIDLNVSSATRTKLQLLTAILIEVTQALQGRHPTLTSSATRRFYISSEARAILHSQLASRAKFRLNQCFEFNRLTRLGLSPTAVQALTTLISSFTRYGIELCNNKQLISSKLGSITSQQLFLLYEYLHAALALLTDPQFPDIAAELNKHCSAPAQLELNGLKPLEKRNEEEKLFNLSSDSSNHPSSNSAAGKKKKSSKQLLFKYG